ncbi:recombinase RecU [Bacillus cereus]|uniref:Recombinase RecU n=1 Tax=Bacillus cereus TaxID=1396 RepID=A0A2B0MSB4_BACCE|nr:recombinase RecU [Bacillus cereus]
MALGNRGMHFEKLINLSNEIPKRGSGAYKQAANH